MFPSITTHRNVIPTVLDDILESLAEAFSPVNPDFGGSIDLQTEDFPLIVDDEIDFLIFFWDPLEPQPHDPDVKALLRMAVVWNIPIANNRASADFMISSPLMDSEYDRLVPDYENYAARKIDLGEKTG